MSRQVALTEDNKRQSMVDSIALVLILCILSLRALYLETLQTSLINMNLPLTNPGLSLLISSALLGVLVFWWLAHLLRPGGSIRLTGIEAGFILFLMGGIIAAIAASDKRAAINELFTLAVPILMAVVLVHLLRDAQKVRLVLLVLLTLGVVSSVQCLSQFYESNEQMIRAYEENPQAQLKAIGIEPNSFEHMLYEHRLYSRDIRGFLTTGNSAATFAVLAAFSGMALLLETWTVRKDKNTAPLLGVLVLAMILTLIGLALTHSKGGIGAFILAVLFLAICLIIGRRLWPFRHVILIVVILVAILSAIGIVAYGTSHGRLPGGNSMLVRWQYWQGAGKMIADHPCTGVGGNNFSIYYTHYKVPAAPETVRDPHNFALNLLSQYGPLGLAGVLLAMFWPVLSLLRASPQGEDKPQPCLPDRLATALLLLIPVTLLIFRPILDPAEKTDIPVVALSVFLTLYVIPAVVFFLTFWLLWRTARETQPITPRPLATMAIVCGLLAVLLHNLIDFAIFEPGNYTVFWALVACAVGPYMNRSKGKDRSFPQSTQVRMGCAFGIGIVTVGVLFFVVVIPVRSSALLQSAIRNRMSSELLLEEAAATDPIDPLPVAYLGKFYMGTADTSNAPLQYLQSALASFEQAALRSNADFKQYRSLTQCAVQLSERETDNRTYWLNQAFEYAGKAIQRYPGSGQLHFQRARIADQLHRTDTARYHYRKAVEIEDAYRRQFAVMYPGRELFSRLGEDNYKWATARLDALKE